MRITGSWSFPTLKALAGDDVGGGEHWRSSVGTLLSCRPTLVQPRFLPYDELLPRTAVYVTNGGYGGVQYALR